MLFVELPKENSLARQQVAFAIQATIEIGYIKIYISFAMFKFFKIHNKIWNRNV